MDAAQSEAVASALNSSLLPQRLAQLEAFAQTAAAAAEARGEAGPYLSGASLTTPILSSLGL